MPQSSTGGRPDNLSPPNPRSCIFVLCTGVCGSSVFLQGRETRSLHYIESEVAAIVLAVQTGYLLLKFRVGVNLLPRPSRDSVCISVVLPTRSDCITITSSEISHHSTDLS